MSPAEALSQDSLRAAARAAGIDAPPVFLETTTSTNAVALRMAGEGAPEWTLVAAAHQTEGRGRLGRTWVGSPGRSLLVSLILRPPLPPRDGPLVSLLAATEMARACGESAAVEVRCRWPNDLVVGARKVGGVLAEGVVRGGRLEALVVGTGVNVAMRPEDFPEGLRGSATSLLAEGGAPDADAVLRAYLAGLRAHYRPARASFREEVLGAYREACATLGRRVRAVTAGGAEVEGLAVDLDRVGGLVVEAGGERATVAFGELEHLDEVP